MKKSKLPFNPHKGDISKILFINRDNRWEIKRGRFKSRTIPDLIGEFGLDDVIEFLNQCLEHEECNGIERVQIFEILEEIRDLKTPMRLKF